MTRKTTLSVAAAATLAAAISIVLIATNLGTTAADAVPPSEHPDVATTVHHALQNGTIAQHGTFVDGCTVTVKGKRYDLGCNHEVLTAGTRSTTPLTTDKPAGFGPADLARALHLPAPNVGEHNTIAIVGIGAYPSLEADLAVYRKTYGLPACTTANGCLHITDYHGGPPLKPGLLTAPVAQAFSIETATDVDQASAACPTCHITMVQLPLDLLKLAGNYTIFPAPLAADFGTAVTTAVKLGATAVSMSYNIANGQQGNLLRTGPPAEAMHHPGVAIVASSGDAGYLGTNLTWPQELPWVISAGGVSITSDDNGTSYTPTAWSQTSEDGRTFVGAGSACGPQSPPAVGQPANVSAACDNHRASSDVSAVAAGVSIYDTYLPNNPTNGWGVVNGTSAASPYLAALYARTGNTAGVEGPNKMYAADPTDIDDVTTGTNAKNGAEDCAAATELCVAGPGWDGPTGIGVPHGLGAF